MRRWAVRIGGVAVLAAGIWFLRVTVLAPQPVPVRVVEAAAGRVEATITNSRAGTVRARRRAKLSPELGGLVVEIPHREGARVEEGAVLIRLDDALQRDRLRLAERELAAAEAEEERTCLGAERAARERRRAEALAADQVVSEDQLDAVQSRGGTTAAACRAAQAQVDRARAAVALARTELAKAVLAAPFAGVVAELSIEVGEWTTPSPPLTPVPAILDLFDPSSIYISAPMDEVDAARLAVDQRVRVSVDSHRGESFPGRVVRVAPYVLDVEEQNRTIEIEVALDAADVAATLLPGTSADVEVILEVREGVLRIPTSVLVEGSKVLVVEDGLLAERRVETGLRNWNFTEVRAGLAPGDRVVASLDRPEVQTGAPAVVAADPGP